MVCTSEVNEYKEKIQPKPKSSDNVWKTQKSRINTSERLKNNDFISQILITYYSLFLVIVSLVDLKSEKIKVNLLPIGNGILEVSFLSLILSIILLVVSVFVFSMNYKERSLRLQTSYIKMNRIYRELKKKETDGEDYSKLLEEFDSILELTENHSECDYYKVLFQVRNETNYYNEPFDFLKYMSLIKCIVMKFILILTLVLTPIIFLVYSYYPF